MKNNLILSLLALFTSILSLSAQAPQDEQESKVRGRKAYFVCTSFPEDFKNPITIRAGKKIHKIELSKRMASSAIKIPKDGVIEVVRLIQNPKQDEDPYRVIGKVKVAENTREALIILNSRRDKETKEEIYAASAHDLAKFKGGDYLYVNLSPANIAVHLGKKKLLVKPNSYQIFNANNLTKSTNVPVQYLYSSRDKAWKLLSASTIVLRPTRREICVFSWNKKYQRVKYHGITFPVEQN